MPTSSPSRSETSIPTNALYATKPNASAFNTCTRAWSTGDRGREGTVRAGELLARLEALGDGKLDLPHGIVDDDETPSGTPTGIVR